MQRCFDGRRIVSPVAFAAAAGLVFVLVAAGVILTAVFAAVLWGAALFAARKTPRIVTYVGHVCADGSGMRRSGDQGGAVQGTCYDLAPSDYTVRPEGKKLPSGDLTRGF